jgi:glycerol-3-phosphate acyltransferase PlsX
MRIVLDVMGGDRPPIELIQGGIAAAERWGIDILFAGDERIIRDVLSQEKVAPVGRFDVLPCTQVIQMDDPPVRSVREKQDASLVRGIEAVRDGAADGFVSPGNTGAVAAASLLILGRTARIPRPALTTSIPTLADAPVTLLDVGANSDCTSDHLLHFALMGTTYARDVLGRVDPSVGLLNIGTEPGKGNRLATETYELLSKSPLHFVGNVEPHQLLFERPADVVVSDGFSGNIFLKTLEGGTSAFNGILKRSIRQSLAAKIGALLMRSAFSAVREALSYRRYGGAPLLGVDGVVVIGHGRSDAEAITSAIDVARREIEADLLGRFRAALEGWKTDGS